MTETELEAARHVIRRYHGTCLSRTSGEGGCTAVFAGAADAAECAVHLQLAYLGASEVGPARRNGLHVALHTVGVDRALGTGSLESGLRRCEHLGTVAHAGQIVLSRATHDCLALGLPDALRLRDLGLHWLRDLTTGEHVYQLCHPELPGHFPPLRSLDVLPHNLPLQLTSFVGRRIEIDAVGRLLDESRLVTLVGAGGCGKTRLALQVAASRLDDHVEGAWFCDLSSVADPLLVAKALASALSLHEERFRSIEEIILAHVGTGNVLLVLDNCEHLIEPAARLVQTLLEGCPLLTVLATSREPLLVPGETTWRVPSMSLPEPRSVSPDALDESEAAQLFIDRARRARPDFAVSGESAPAIAEICRRLDGIPLAIELAASRVKIMTPQQIGEGLNDRFRLLTRGPRTILARQQTLRASMDWSYGLLSEPEKSMLRRLAVFSGGFDLHAAEAVCSGAGLDAYEALDLLAGLVDKSLVAVEDQGDGARYRLLETVRQYALDRLTEAGEADPTRRRHCDFYLRLAETAEPELMRWGQETWADRLELEHDNLRSALEWSRQQAHQELLRLAGALVCFWFMRGHLGEGRRWLEAAAGQGEDAPDGLRARVLWGLAVIAMYQFDLGRVAELADQSLGLYRMLGDRLGIARSQLLVGWVAVFVQGPQARGLLQEGCALARETDDPWCLTMALQALGVMELTYGAPDTAWDAFAESLEIGRKAGQRFATLGASVFLGWTSIWRGEFRHAQSLLAEAVALAKEMKDNFYLSVGLCHLAVTLTGLGDYEKARASANESLEIATKSKNALNVAHALFCVGWVERALGRTDDARSLFAQALELPSMPTIRGLSLIGLAAVDIASGRYADARMHLDEALAVSTAPDIRRVQATVHFFYARLTRAEGDGDDAERRLQRALELYGEVGDKAGCADCFEALASLARERGTAERAVRLLGAASALRDAIAYMRFPCDEESYRRHISALRAELGEEECDKLLSQGATMSEQDVMRLARAGYGARGRPTTGWTSLTPTELRVAELVAQGLTNPQIGDRLFVSRRTVQTHLYRIFAKLNVSSRADLAAHVTRRQAEHSTTP